MVKKIVSKVIFNKKTGQIMIFPSKKKIQASNPSIKFDEIKFAELRFLDKKKK